MNNTAELVVFIIYFLFMIGIGVFFFLRSKNGGEKNTSSAGAKWGPGSPRCPPALPI
jgi:sodium/proline symporter